MAFISTNSFASWIPADTFFASEFKFQGEDPFATIFQASQVDNPKMEIEETPSMQANSMTTNEESLFEIPALIPDTLDSLVDDRSKDGLKFCRRISTAMIEVNRFPDGIYERIMTFTSEVLLSLLNPLNLHGVSSSQITELQYACLERLWSEFKDIMSYSKNKKICIVKQEYWNMIFEKKGCTALLKEIFETLSKTWKSPAGKLVLGDAVFCELFAQVLFQTNKLAVILLILEDTSEKGKSLRELKTINNFFMMMLMPELMQFYNHRRGRFALECCRKCKICNSKQIPSDFLSTLRESRRKVESIVSIINQIFLKFESKSFDRGSCLVELALIQF